MSCQPVDLLRRGRDGLGRRASAAGGRRAGFVGQQAAGLGLVAGLLIGSGTGCERTRDDGAGHEGGQPKVRNAGSENSVDPGVESSPSPKKTSVITNVYVASFRARAEDRSDSCAAIDLATDPALALTAALRAQGQFVIVDAPVGRSGAKPMRVDLLWRAISPDGRACALVAQTDVTMPAAGGRNRPISAVMVIENDHAGDARRIEEAVQRMAEVLATELDLREVGEWACDGRTSAIAQSPSSAGAGTLDAVLICLDWLTAHSDRLVAPRRDTWAERALQLTSHADPDVHRAALELLARIGRAAQVPTLLRRIRLADPRTSRVTYETLGELGGEHAAAFLRFAARNEETEEGRQQAATALRRLQARAKAQPATRRRGRSSRIGHR